MKVRFSGTLKAHKYLNKDQEIRNPDRLFSNKKTALFFTAWVSNGYNATRAYAAINTRYNLDNPKQYQSAATLGARLLKSIEISQILEAYDLGYEKYFKVFKEGLEASDSKPFYQKEETVSDHSEPNYLIRKAYHDKLGRLLGLES